MAFLVGFACLGPPPRAFLLVRLLSRSFARFFRSRGGLWGFLGRFWECLVAFVRSFPGLPFGLSGGLGCLSRLVFGLLAVFLGFRGPRVPSSAFLFGPFWSVEVVRWSFWSVLLA